MTFDEVQGFLGVLGEVFIEGDAHEDHNTDNQDNHPKVDEVQEGVRFGRSLFTNRN